MVSDAPAAVCGAIGDSPRALGEGGMAPEACPTKLGAAA
jgi:hypothetical protein